MWILASSHGISSPLNQIFGVGVMGMSVRSPRESWTSDPSGDGVADLGGRTGLRGRVGAGLADAGGGVGLAQELQHHGRAEDRGRGVGLGQAGDVGRRAGLRLEY